MKYVAGELENLPKTVLELEEIQFSRSQAGRIFKAKFHIV